MLDRESTFADKEIISMLKTRFVPVAIDQAYQRRQRDAEGDFYRKIAGQGPRNNFQGTTQGIYIASPSGKLLVYNNNRGSGRIKRLMKQSLAGFRAGKTKAIATGVPDPKYNPMLPSDGLVVRVRGKVLDGYEPSDNPWRRIFQTAISRDNLWITPAEHQALVDGKVPQSLQTRIARFHLVDNTRGEPPMWRAHEVIKTSMSIDNGELLGQVRLQTEDGSRGYEAQLRGKIERKDGKIARFDVIALGDFWGEGIYTRGAPKGKFPLAISMSLADGSDVADAIPPQGSRGWLPGYLK